jgi:transcriptional regulator with XRE-family HTH domain
VDGITRITPLFDFAPMYLDPEGIVRAARWYHQDTHKELQRWEDILAHLALPAPERRHRRFRRPQHRHATHPTSGIEVVMGKRKPLDKAQIRERRNQLLASAGAAELSVTEGVREMRAIAGLTQEEFARHRGVSARVVKALELGQGNPTVATLNRIGQFFGLEVAFVPIRRVTDEVPPPAGGVKEPPAAQPILGFKNFETLQKRLQEMHEKIEANNALLVETRAQLDASLNHMQPAKKTKSTTG